MLRRALPTTLLALLACSSPAALGPLTPPDDAASDAAASDAAEPDATTTDVAASDADVDARADTSRVEDARPAGADAGPLGDPAWATLEVRTSSPCPALTACGGAVRGTWDVAGGCFDLPVPAELMRCPGARISRTSGRARGRVEFGPVIAARQAEWEVEAELSVPMACANIVGGCAGLEGILRGGFPDSRCAGEMMAGACRCTVRQTGSLRDGDAYSTSNNQIVSTNGGRRWDYCVTGDRLRYRDATPTGPREPGVIELARRAR